MRSGRVNETDFCSDGCIKNALEKKYLTNESMAVSAGGRNHFWLFSMRGLLDGLEFKVDLRWTAFAIML